MFSFSSDWSALWSDGWMHQLAIWKGFIVLTQNCGFESIFNYAGIGRAETIKISQRYWCHFVWLVKLCSYVKILVTSKWSWKPRDGWVLELYLILIYIVLKWLDGLSWFWIGLYLCVRYIVLKGVWFFLQNTGNSSYQSWWYRMLNYPVVTTTQLSFRGGAP